MKVTLNLNQTSLMFKYFKQQQNRQITRPKNFEINTETTLKDNVSFCAVKFSDLITYVKIIPTKKLAEHIEFKEGTTIEAAKEFARKNFHIDEFNLTSLNCANYINEGLSLYNNMHKGKTKLPSTILSTTSKVLMAVNFSNKLFINEELMEKDVNRKTINKYCKKLLEYEPFINFSNEELSLLNKGLNNIKLDFKENLKLVLLLQFNKNYNPITLLYKSDKLPKILKTHKDLPKTYAEISSLKNDEYEEVTQKIISVYKETGFKGEITKLNDFSTLFHELGHNAHRQKIGDKKFEKLCAFFIFDVQEEYDWDKINPIGKNITSLVSAYSSNSPSEFVAETYVALLSGNKFSKEIMELYKKFGGPNIP